MTYRTKSDSDSATGRRLDDTLPPVTIQMLNAGITALKGFDYESEEVSALVAEIYWAMAALSPQRR